MVERIHNQHHLATLQELLVLQEDLVDLEHQENQFLFMQMVVAVVLDLLIVQMHLVVDLVEVDVLVVQETLEIPLQHLQLHQHHRM
jgi:hypothetical protein